MSDYADKNELYHWLKGKEKPGHKYTSRYMKNGKWRYVYGAAKNLGDRIKDWWGVDEKERYNNASHDYRLERLYGVHGTNPERLRSKSFADRDKSKKRGADGRHPENGKVVQYETYWDGYDYKVKDNYDPGDYSRKSINAKRNAYERAKTAYYKTPMGKLEKAGEKVSKAMSKASSWIRKRTSSVKKKLSELSGGKEKLAKANRATVNYASSIVKNAPSYNKKGEASSFNRQELNAKRNAYQRSQDAYNKSLRGRISNAFTTKKKKKNK